ncbi:MAG: hypothetical protein ACK4WJ_01655 [Endomicrobiia bacterium]
MNKLIIYICQAVFPKNIICDKYHTLLAFLRILYIKKLENLKIEKANKNRRLI